jgi:hypothetical protein
MLTYALIAWTCGFGCSQTNPQPYPTERACIAARDKYQEWADKHLLHLYDGLRTPTENAALRPGVFKWASCRTMKS